MCGNVGYPLKHVEYKLIDVPELKYFVTDKNEYDELSPRGELLIRTVSCFKKYYKNDDMTKRVLDSEGFYHTGDIA